MAKSSLASSFMGEVRKGARMRLDALADIMPEQKPQRMPFEQYLSQAQEQAQRDPDFAERFRIALEQYHRLGG